MNKEDKGIQIIKKSSKGKTQVEFDIKVTSPYITKKMDEVISLYNQITNINGFRKGKAPKELVYRKQLHNILKETYQQITNDISKITKKEIPEIVRITIDKDFHHDLEGKKDIEVKIITDKISKIQFPDIKNIKVKIDEAKAKFEKSLDEIKKNKKREDEYSYLKDHAKEYIEHYHEDLIMKKIIDSIKLTKEDIPKHIIENYIHESQERINEYAKKMNLDYRTYLEKIKQSEEKLKKELEEEVINKIKLELLVDAAPEEYKPQIKQEDIQMELEYIKKHHLNNKEASDIIYSTIRNKTIQNLINKIKEQ